MNNKNELTNSLVKVMGDNYFNYRGCLIERLVGGFRFNGKKIPNNYKLLDEEIDRTLTAISTSIKKADE